MNERMRQNLSYERQTKAPRQIAKCENCNDSITDQKPYWTDEEGNIFCSVQCALEYHDIHKVEDEL